MHKEHVSSGYGGFNTEEKEEGQGGGDMRSFKNIHEHTRDIAYFIG